MTIKNSLLLRIGIFFIIAIIAITFLFYIIEKHEYQNEKGRLYQHYHQLGILLMKNRLGSITESELMDKLSQNNVTLIKDEKLHTKIKNKVSKNATKYSVGNFYVYEEKDFRYVVLPPIHGPILFKDNNRLDIDLSYVWWLYAAFISIVLFLFIPIVISLYPLKKLQKQIKRFGEGDTNVNFSSSRKDEIAEVSNEFDKAAKKIKDVFEARAIFLRNITHEIKTPITSGKLALEFLEESKSKQVLSNVFTRLELLTKEFAHIEKITATDQKLKTKSYPLTDILDQATDMLFLEPNTIKNNFEKNRLEVNFELFTFVFKNLIDNGLKYSHDNDFFIECDGKDIHFCSKGEPMDEPLEHYLQPFTTSDEKSTESFGLGLYIVDAILKKHKFVLSYKYENGYNCFTIVLRNSINK